MRHSQGIEEDIILEYFSMTGLFVDGHHRTFLDLGANDGTTLSNTRALALLGWSGVLVEPSPVAFARLQTLYRNAPDIETHNVGMCEGNGLAILHESGPHLGNGDHALLSTLKAEETEKWVKAGAVFTPVEMECLTFHELLKRSQFSHFDFITIDIEGMELEVLEQIDLSAVGCQLLVIEVNDRAIAPYVDYCASYGMKMMSQRTPENILFHP